LARYNSSGARFAVIRTSYSPMQVIKSRCTMDRD